MSLSFFATSAPFCGHFVVFMTLPLQLFSAPRLPQTARMLETTAEVECPHCGETILLFLDLSIEEQSYIEDCSVCCQPMTVSYSAADGELGSLNVEASS
jgi:hypothetical protein